MFCGAETFFEKSFLLRPYLPKTFKIIAFTVPIKTIPILFTKKGCCSPF